MDGRRSRENRRDKGESRGLPSTPVLTSWGKNNIMRALCRISM